MNMQLTQAFTQPNTQIEHMCQTLLQICTFFATNHQNELPTYDF